jgi:hypothetical protein
VSSARRLADLAGGTHYQAGHHASGVGRLGGVRIDRRAADDSVIEKTRQRASLIEEASGAVPHKRSQKRFAHVPSHITPFPDRYDGLMVGRAVLGSYSSVGNCRRSLLGASRGSNPTWMWLPERGVLGILARLRATAPAHQLR